MHLITTCIVVTKVWYSYEILIIRVTLVGHGPIWSTIRWSRHGMLWRVRTEPTRVRWMCLAHVERANHVNCEFQGKPSEWCVAYQIQAFKRKACFHFHSLDFILCKKEVGALEGSRLEGVKVMVLILLSISFEVWILVEFGLKFQRTARIVWRRGRTVLKVGFDSIWWVPYSGH